MVGVWFDVAVVDVVELVVVAGWDVVSDVEVTGVVDVVDVVVVGVVGDAVCCWDSSVSTVCNRDLNCSSSSDVVNRDEPPRSVMPIRSNTSSSTCKMRSNSGWPRPNTLCDDMLDDDDDYVWLCDYVFCALCCCRCRNAMQCCCAKWW